MTSLTVIFTIGVSFLFSINSGLYRFYKNNITGDYIIHNSIDEDMSLFGAVTPAIDEFIKIPVLDSFYQLKDALKNSLEVVNMTYQISGNAIMDINSKRKAIPFFGVEPESYFNMFDKIEIKEGSLFSSGEKGALINIKLKSFYNVEIGDSLLLTLFDTNGFKIRDLVIKGFYSYPNDSEYIEDLIFIDVDTARGLISLNAFQEVHVDNSSSDLLGEDWDSFFTQDEESSLSSDSFSIDDFFSDIDDITISERDGEWNFILLKTEAKVTKEDIHRAIDSVDGNFTLLNWREAAGQSALLGLLLGYFFTGGFILAAIAGVIGIINIINISVISRREEIGAIRALGGHKSFVYKSLLLETSILGLTGGILGLIFSFIIISVINSSYINLDIQIIKTILGSPTLRIEETANSISISLLFILLFTFVSSIIPLYRALRISPLEAMEER